MNHEEANPETSSEEPNKEDHHNAASHTTVLTSGSLIHAITVSEPLSLQKEHKTERHRDAVEGHNGENPKAPILEARHHAEDRSKALDTQPRDGKPKTHRILVSDPLPLRTENELEQYRDAVENHRRGTPKTSL